MASIREIAEKAKVSPGTVSRTLNNKGYIAKETRAKVEQALKELDYVPNELARNLYRKRSNMIGIILPDIEHPFFMSIIKHLVKELQRVDYHAVLWTTEYKAEKEQHYLDMLKRNIVDGVVIAIPLLPNKVYQELGRPVVMLDKMVDGIPWVAVNHIKSGHLAAEQFAKEHRRHVVVTTGTDSAEIPSSNREHAFRDCCGQLGVAVEACELSWTRFDLQYAQKIASYILDTFPEADGIFTSDVFATACYREAKERGIQIPEELSIISTDGVYSSDYSVVNFSSVVQPTKEIAKTTSRMVLDLIDERGENKPSKMIDVYFAPGETTIGN